MCVKPSDLLPQHRVEKHVAYFDHLAFGGHGPERDAQVHTEPDAQAHQAELERVAGHVGEQVVHGGHIMSTTRPVPEKTRQQKDTDNYCTI